MGRAAAVEAEGELVQVPVELGGRGGALVGAAQPAGQGPLDRRQVGEGRGPLGHEAELGQRPPGLQAHGPDQRARLHHPAGEGGQLGRGPATAAAACGPGRASRPGPRGRWRPWPGRPAGRVGPSRGRHGPELDPADQLGPARADHGPAEAVQHRPGRLVAAQVQRPGQLAGRDALLGRGHQPGGREPLAQRRARALEQGAGGDRGLVPAGAADQPLARPPPRRPACPQAGQRNPCGQLRRSR